MKVNDQIKDEKLQYDINREAAKMSALSQGKITKYEYLTGEDIVSSDESRMTKQAKFTYSTLGKAFAKQTKSIEDQGDKQIKTYIYIYIYMCVYIYYIFILISIYLLLLFLFFFVWFKVSIRCYFVVFYVYIYFLCIFLYIFHIYIFLHLYLYISTFVYFHIFILS